MNGLLADINAIGQVDHLVVLMQAEPWKEFWDHLNLQYLHFADVGLDADTPDSVVWRTCQDRQLVLITDNRNLDSPESLEATIRSENAPTSLPVFTIANIQRLAQSHVYTAQVIESLLDALLRIDTLRGTGRMYLP